MYVHVHVDVTCVKMIGWNVSDSLSLPAGIIDLFEVTMFLRNRVDWLYLGLGLGLLYPTLKMIRADHHGKPDDCKMEMLAAWLRQQDNVPQKGAPSWSALRAALKRIGKNELADRILFDGELSC